MEGFITPPNHNGFHAKKLFDKSGMINWGAIAYLEKNGGGPKENHTHDEDHLFIVTSGEARVIVDDTVNLVKPNESFFVKGSLPHSVWNNSDKTTVIIKLSLEP